ncbi:uncharacterized protein LOC136078307 [Hydra vulgaris]|uniref:Uncharacterized protein LOC136078307 n=1 Tax=Hydra vulgaris TaxID=6087 RepID=A0ABM4BLF6_HYDVU
MENYKALEAYKYFVSGWVQPLYHIVLNFGHVLLKGEVKPSYKTNNSPYTAWVALTKNGSVVSSHCNCMAGLGETCSHVAAILFKIEAAVRLGIISKTCTDVPCQWNQIFTRDVKPAPITGINFYSDKAKCKLQLRMREPVVAALAEDQNHFLKSLEQSNPKIAVLSLFKGFQTPFLNSNVNQLTLKLPQTLRSFYQHSYLNLSEQDFVIEANNLAKSLSITAKEVNYLEEATRAQSACVLWHEHRSGRITGSCIYDVMRASLKAPSKSLVLKITKPNFSSINTPSLLWGKEKEEIALAEYINICSVDGYVTESICLSPTMVHKDFEVIRIGFYVCQQKPWLGVSPDGFAFCSCCGYAAIEVKCPYSLKEKGLSGAINSNRFYIKTQNSKYYLDSSHYYYAQIQCEIFILEVNYCDLIVWTPTEFVVCRIEKNLDFIENIIVKSHSFWREVILPELMTRRIENAEPILNREKSKLSYCICNNEQVNTSTENDGDMVGCDKCDQWFHLKCLKLKRLPTSKVWYCQKCKNGIKSKYLYFIVACIFLY